MDLGPASFSAWVREPGEAAGHHDCVFDEDGVWELVGFRDLDCLDPLSLESLAVGKPLTFRQIDIDRHSLEVGELAFGEPPRGWSDECAHAVRSYQQSFKRGICT